MFYLLFLTFRKYVDEEAIALVDHILFFVLNLYGVQTCRDSIAMMTQWP